MKNKLNQEIEKILRAYQSILDNWSNFDARQVELAQCQMEINSLEFSQEDYQTESVYTLLLELKKTHQTIYERSLVVLSDTKSKHETVVSSKKNVLKYSRGE